ICRVIGLTDCNHLAKGWFRRTTLKATYQGLTYLVGEVSSWQSPNYLQVVKPPLMDKRPSGRPKSINHIISQGEEQAKISARGSSQQAHDNSQQSKLFSF
ncbi:hypothetical protein Tco_1348205, partial [Tanacetum coccineum]